MKKFVARLLIFTMLLGLNSGYLSNGIVLATSNAEITEYKHSSTTGEFLTFGSTVEKNGGYRFTEGGNSYVRTPVMSSVKKGDDVKLVLTIEGASGNNSNIYVKNTGIYKEIKFKNLGHSAKTQVLEFEVNKEIISYQRFLEISIKDGNDGDYIDVSEIEVYINGVLMVEKSTSSVSGIQPPEEPTPEEPTPEEPTPEEPTTEEPTTEEPTPEEPTTEEPTTEEPTTEEPTTEEPTTEEPTPEEPTTVNYKDSSVKGDFQTFGSTFEKNSGYRFTEGGNSYVRTPVMSNVKKGDDVKLVLTIEGASGSNSNIYVKNTGIYKEIKFKNLGHSTKTQVLEFEVNREIISYQRFLEISIKDGNDGDYIDVNGIEIYINGKLMMEKSTSSVSGSITPSEPVQEEPKEEEPVQEEPVQEEPVQEEPVQEEPVQEEPDTSRGYFPIVTGERGVVDTSYTYGHVHRYGAVGDGVTNDVKAFKLAFDQNDVVTMENKTYLWNDGAYMNHDQVINGNGATIITGDNFAPTGDFKYGLLRYRYDSYKAGTKGKYEINDLTIHWDSSFDRDGDFVVFYPLGFAEVVLNRVNITSEEGNKTRLHLIYATEGINTYIDCNFINRSQGRSGGVLWLHNTDVSVIPEIYASRTVMINYCSDELLALYGVGGYELLFEDCELIAYNTYLKKETLMLAFYGGTDSKYSGATLNNNAKFVRTTIECHDDESLPNHLVTMIGAGTSNWNRTNVIEFEECTIVNNSYRTFTSAWQSREDLSNYNDPRHTKIKFYNSDITLKTAVSGNLTAYKLKEAGSSNPNVSMEFYDCNIKARHALVDASNQIALGYDFVMDNCDVDIQDAEGVVIFYQKDSTSIKVTNNRIKMDKSVPMVNYTTTNLNKWMPKDGYEKVYFSNNTLNNARMSNIDTYVSYK